MLAAVHLRILVNIVNTPLINAAAYCYHCGKSTTEETGKIASKAKTSIKKQKKEQE